MRLHGQKPPRKQAAGSTCAYRDRLVGQGKAALLPGCWGRAYVPRTQSEGRKHAKHGQWRSCLNIWGICRVSERVLAAAAHPGASPARRGRAGVPAPRSGSGAPHSRGCPGGRSGGSRGGVGSQGHQCVRSTCKHCQAPISQKDQPVCRRQPTSRAPSCHHLQPPPCLCASKMAPCTCRSTHL
jgi:hypothetical protein